MPNTFAYAMLLAWPLIVLIMFRKMPIERALIWSILGGYLFLPPSLANFDLPMIPALDKVSIPNIAALLICIFVMGRRISLVPESLLARILLLLFLVSPFVTVVMNSDPIIFGFDPVTNVWLDDPDDVVLRQLPGLRLYDGLAAIANQAIFILPFFMARQLLATPQALRELVFALFVAGLIYSFPMLLEVRLSPQLNTWIYGFFQHDFLQMIRQGGFRPIVFLPHGLWVAFFAFMCVIAALALLRCSTPDSRSKYLLATLYLAVVLVFTRSLGPLTLTLAVAPLVLLLPQKLQIRFAVIMAIIAFSYPILRGSGLVPVDLLVDFAARIDEERAGSLQFRFDHEDALLSRASERLLFGWGLWGRNQIHDPLTGAMLSVSDGRWVIVIGVYGWLGYAVEFGLLALPLLMLAMQARHFGRRQLSPFIGPLALVLGANMIDLLPNATLIPFTWLLAGAILGHAELLRRHRHRDYSEMRPPHPSNALSAAAKGQRTIL